MTNPDYANFFPAQRKTRLPGGYMGKILRVDMTTGKLTDLNLPEEPLLRKYWGGQLFAEYVLLNELPLDIDPYDATKRHRRHDRSDHRHRLHSRRHENVFCLFEPGDAPHSRPRRDQRLFWHVAQSRRLRRRDRHRRGADRRSIFTSAKTKSSCATPAKSGAKASATPKTCCAKNPAIRMRASAASARRGKISFAPRCWSTTTITPRRTAWAR